MPLDDLKNQARPPSETGYSYVVASVKEIDGHFVQHGSGPNLQGGYVTLCTCKHRMRTFLDWDKWEGVWVAGFSGVRAGGGRNALVYLMRVGWAFKSHQDLWNSPEIPTLTKEAKAAHVNALGDLFWPKGKKADPYAPGDYQPPIEGHVHQRAKDPKAWHHDICYFSRSGKPAALLVGDPENAFLWERPLIFSQRELGRAVPKWSMGDFLSQLGS